MRITVTTKERAWEKANEIFPTDYEKDYIASGCAGYDIYRHHELNYYSRICDLGDRLEVLTGEYGENVTNIWIEPETKTAEPAQEEHFGRKWSERIRTATPFDYSSLTDYEKFILNDGYKFKTEEELRAGYDRAWKNRHGIMLTEEEFIIEAGEYLETETLKVSYAKIVDFIKQKKLDAGAAFRYARYRWCLRDPDAIIAYEESRDKWVVNNCDEKISEEKAIIAVNGEWGFEASKIKIVGVPYYTATDYHYIRFDCRQMNWLWANGNLYQVYV